MRRDVATRSARLLPWFVRLSVEKKGSRALQNLAPPLFFAPGQPYWAATPFFCRVIPPYLDPEPPLSHSHSLISTRVIISIRRPRCRCKQRYFSPVHRKLFIQVKALRLCEIRSSSKSALFRCAQVVFPCLSRRRRGFLTFELGCHVLSYWCWYIMYHLKFRAGVLCTILGHVLVYSVPKSRTVVHDSNH